MTAAKNFGCSSTEELGPSRDEKILTSWNGLDDQRTVELTRHFEKQQLQRAGYQGGRLFSSRRQLRNQGSLYSYIDGSKLLRASWMIMPFTAALLDLYEATFPGPLFTKSAELPKTKELFWDEANSGFLLFTKGAEPLPLNP